ncbi:hypothetical protein LSAT2_012744 [Lamellibrachia satsuma]|nr:hypothetical protein LSAT2_012744 [Lamellibrachia satsuma]
MVYFKYAEIDTLPNFTIDRLLTTMVVKFIKLMPMSVLLLAVLLPTRSLKEPPTGDFHPVPCAARAFGPSPARPAARGPGRAGPLHNFAGRAGPGPTYCGPGPGLG